MSAEIKTDITTQEPLKSKRLSSFIWILVLWVFVYLISGLDGISWKRAFPHGVVFFGLWPATVFLGISILVRSLVYQATLRWAACFSVIGSFTSLFFFDKQNAAETYISYGQSLAVLMVLSCISIHRYLSKRVYDN